MKTLAHKINQRSKGPVSIEASAFILKIKPLIKYLIIFTAYYYFIHIYCSMSLQLIFLLLFPCIKAFDIDLTFGDVQ